MNDQRLSPEAISTELARDDIDVDIVCRHYMGYIYTVAKNRCRGSPNIDINDLISAGCLALVNVLRLKLKAIKPDKVDGYIRKTVSSAIWTAAKRNHLIFDKSNRYAKGLMERHEVTEDMILDDWLSEWLANDTVETTLDRVCATPYERELIELLMEGHTMTEVCEILPVSRWIANRMLEEVSNRFLNT